MLWSWWFCHVRKMPPSFSLVRCETPTSTVSLSATKMSPPLGQWSVWDSSGKGWAFSLWQGTKWMQSETTSSFPAEIVIVHATRLGDSLRIIWSIRGQVLQTSDEISSIWKNLDLQYPPCLFSVCLCPRQYPSLDISTLHKPNILLIDHGTNPSRQIQPLLQAGGYWSKKHVYYLSGFHPHFTCIYTLFWETNETSTLISSKPVNLPLLQPNSFNGNLRIIHKALIDLHILQAGM